MTGYYNRLIESMKKYGDIEIAYDGKEHLTYSSLLSAADGYASLLAEKGIRPGDRVTLLAYNSCAWLKAFFGIVCYGAIAVLMNYALPESEIITLRREMESDLLIYGPYKEMEKDPASPERIQPDARKRTDITVLDFPAVRNFSPREGVEKTYGNPAFVVFTSGSTGKPKGALLSARSNITGADAYVEAIPQIERETFMMGVPLFHIFGMGIAMSHILYGGKLILPDVFTSEKLIRFALESGAEAFAAVMTVVVRMMEDSRFPSAGMPHVKRIYVGGAPLLPIQVMRVGYSFPKATLLNSYGQTESDTGIAMTRVSDSVEKRVNTVGRPLPHRKVVIMGPEGKHCVPGEIGEITILDEGTVMCGYYNVPPEQQAIDGNGYLHTADLGFLDEDGYLHLSGRIKDIIIKGGENIIPGEIEAEINALDGVREVKVMGAYDELYGENVQACLSLKPGFRLTEENIREALTGKIPRFRMPVNFFIFEEFPLKANGKLDACELASRMLRRLDARKVAEDLENGIEICSIRMACLEFVIAPILRCIPEIFSSMGFSKPLVRRIMMCTEELLVERVGDRYLGRGNFCLKVQLRRECLRIIYTDDDPTLPFDKAEQDHFRAIRSRLVYYSADRVTVDRTADDSFLFMTDFLYDKDFSPMNYILNTGRSGQIASDR